MNASDLKVGLSSVNLRRVEGVNDRSGFIAAEVSEDDLFRMVQETNVEAFYDKIGDELTFRTVFIPLSPDCARAIVAADRAGVEAGTASGDGAAAALAELSEAITATLETDFGGGSVFVRLSTRSPKDSSFARSRSSAYVEEQLSNCPSTNGKLRLLFEAALRGMQVDCAADAMELLATSSRVYEDLVRALEHEESYAMMLIVREWTDIPLESEWRCFVRGKRLTAISQFYYQVFWEDMESRAEAAKRAIIEFFPLVRDRLPDLDDYILDVTVAADGSSIRVIELNPFYAGTGALLYSWKADHAILHGETGKDGDEEVDIRWVAEPLGEMSAANTATFEELLSANPHALLAFPDWQNGQGEVPE